jgi:hypothetical protein
MTIGRIFLSLCWAIYDDILFARFDQNFTDFKGINYTYVRFPIKLEHLLNKKFQNFLKGASSIRNWPLK